MKRVAIIIGSVLAVGVAALVGIVVLVASIIRVPYPPQPKFGFTGDWRSTDVFGFEERPLPPAARVWQDYDAWRPSTNEHSRRLYLARLGSVASQSGFRSWVSSGDTPMGAQRYTNVEFTYTDSTNATYIISWYLRGEHDTRFLRFDGTQRLYQLQPYGTPGEHPPRLSIVGIEGIRPEHYREP